jgi:dCTP deaminase
MNQDQALSESKCCCFMGEEKTEIVSREEPVKTAETIADDSARVCGVLPDSEIIKRVVIQPLCDRFVNSGMLSYGLSSYGYTFRLGDKFAFLKRSISGFNLDPKKPEYSKSLFEEVTIQGAFYLAPHSFCLAESLEWFKIPRDVIAICVGKSSYARCGIILNMTPLEPEWCGKLTIEIFNSSDFPVRLYPCEGIGQIIFFSAEKQCSLSYSDRGGRYNNQPGLVYSSEVISNDKKS